jgi:hypothetical protein
MDIAALAALAQGSTGAAAAAPVQAGYGVSLTDLGGFNDALARASGRLEAQRVDEPSEAARKLVTPFEHINLEAVKLGEDAQAAKAAGREFTPGEIVQLTVRSQEFMFHCQLMSNIANRTSDGLQQLFRQQG